MGFNNLSVGGCNTFCGYHSYISALNNSASRNQFIPKLKIFKVIYKFDQPYSEYYPIAFNYYYKYIQAPYDSYLFLIPAFLLRYIDISVKFSFLLTIGEVNSVIFQLPELQMD